MLDLNKPVQTRDGRKARIICDDRKGNNQIVALIDEAEYEVLYGYTIDGIRAGENKRDADDLINVPEKYVRYINIDKERDRVVIDGMYSIRDQADQVNSNRRIACIRVEFQEGQLDK